MRKRRKLPRGFDSGEARKEKQRRFLELRERLLERRFLELREGSCRGVSFFESLKRHS